MNIRLRLSIIFGLGFISIMSLGTRAETKTAEVRPLMSEFLGSLSDLYPYMTNYRRFADPKNTKDIQKKLDLLASWSGDLAHYESLKTPGFSVSAKLVGEHVKRMREVYSTGNKLYAHWMLNATLQGCMSCHAQLKSTQFPELSVAPEKLKGSPMERAEFLFATRNFAEALKLYDEVLSAFEGKTGPDDDLVASDVEKALRRKLTIHLRIRRDPAAAALAVMNDQQRENLPRQQKENLGAWLRELGDGFVKKVPDVKKISASALERYVQSILKADYRTAVVISQPESAVRYLLLSGVLYEYLTVRPEAKNVSQILLWLAKADRALNNDFFFSLSDVYLKECIVRSPKSKIAKECYQEFEESILFQFTGSRGTDIPVVVREDLKNLRAKAY